MTQLPKYYDNVRRFNESLYNSIVRTAHSIANADECKVSTGVLIEDFCMVLANELIMDINYFRANYVPKDNYDGPQMGD
jgi:hypothetical protein